MEEIKTKATKIKTLYEALLEVQREVPAIQKNGINPHFKSKYITLDSLMSQVLPVLHKHNFIWITLPTTENSDPSLSYALIYTPTGEKIEGTMSLQAKGVSPQDQGSAITYAKRYSISALLGIVADEDDDGSKAQEAVASTVTEPNKRNLIQIAAKLNMDEDALEKRLGEPLDTLSNAKAIETIDKLKTALLRQSA